MQVHCQVDARRSGLDWPFQCPYSSSLNFSLRPYETTRAAFNKNAIQRHPVKGCVWVPSSPGSVSVLALAFGYRLNVRDLDFSPNTRSQVR